MKTITLLCSLLFIVLHTQGKNFPVLLPGNWIDLEYTTFFPPTNNIGNTNPWQAENVRKITIRIVVDKSAQGAKHWKTRWKIYLRHVYHNRTLSLNNYREYFDSYCSETALSANYRTEKPLNSP